MPQSLRPSDTAPTTQLERALDQNSNVKDTVQQSSAELAVISAVLKQELPSEVKKGDVAQALQNTEFRTPRTTWPRSTKPLPTKSMSAPLWSASLQPPKPLSHAKKANPKKPYTRSDPAAHKARSPKIAITCCATTPHRALQGQMRRGLQRMFGVKLAAVIQQRRRPRAMVAALDFTDKNDVVAFFIAATVKAFKSCRRAIEQRQAARAIGVCHVLPAVFTPAGKALCQVLLVGRQNIDDVVRALCKSRHGAGGL
jgi:hypothetical protein